MVVLHVGLLLGSIFSQHCWLQPQQIIVVNYEVFCFIQQLDYIRVEHHLILAEDKVIFFQGKVFQNLWLPVKINSEADKGFVINRAF